MNIYLIVFSSLVCLFLLSAHLLSRSDHKADAVERSRLIKFQPTDPPLFSHALVKELPEPARRYFLFTIATGTPLFTVADIFMQGQFSLGSKTQPNYMRMRAKQTLSSPHGFIWQMKASQGPMVISGSDSAS